MARSDSFRAQGQAARDFRPERALDALCGRVLFCRRFPDQRDRADWRGPRARTFFAADALVGDVRQKNFCGVSCLLDANLGRYRRIDT